MRALTLAAVISVIGLKALSQTNHIIRDLTLYYKGTAYECLLSKAEIIKTPSWKADAPNPPLSPRAAEAIASSYLKKLIPAENWSRLSITLANPLSEHGREYWLYEVKFGSFNKGGWTFGPSPEFTVTVLMNGTVVQCIKEQKH